MFCHYQAIPADWPRNSLLRLFYYRASSWTGCETGMQSLDTAITGLSRQLSQHRKKVRDEAAKKYGSGCPLNIEYLGGGGSAGGGSAGGGGAGAEDAADEGSAGAAGGGDADAAGEGGAGAAGGGGTGSSDVGDSSAAGREGTSREARSSPEEPTNASYNARGELITGISFDLEYELDDLNSPSWVSISNIQF